MVVPLECPQPKVRGNACPRFPIYGTPVLMRVMTNHTNLINNLRITCELRIT